MENVQDGQLEDRPVDGNEMSLTTEQELPDTESSSPQTDITPVEGDECEETKDDITLLQQGMIRSVISRLSIKRNLFSTTYGHRYRHFFSILDQLLCIIF